MFNLSLKCSDFLPKITLNGEYRNFCKTILIIIVNIVVIVKLIKPASFGRSSYHDECGVTGAVIICLCQQRGVSTGQCGLVIKLNMRSHYHYHNTQY